MLKVDGYEIVGRYLTEPGQSLLDPKDYFKAIRPGELERITWGGMKFFLIFQEYSTKLERFTPANGAAHARAAREAAQRLGIPPTHIYFAVDFDATDDQVTSNILPYFRAILANLGGGIRLASTLRATSAAVSLKLGRPVMRSCQTCRRDSRATLASPFRTVGFMTSLLRSVIIRVKVGILTVLPIPAKWTPYLM